MASKTRITKDRARELVINATLTGELNAEVKVQSGFWIVYLDRDRKGKGEVIWGTFSLERHRDFRHLTGDASTETIGELIDMANEVHRRVHS